MKHPNPTPHLTRNLVLLYLFAIVGVGLVMAGGHLAISGVLYLAVAAAAGYGLWRRQSPAYRALLVSHFWRAMR